MSACFNQYRSEIQGFTYGGSLSALHTWSWAQLRTAAKNSDWTTQKGPSTKMNLNSSFELVLFRTCSDNLLYTSALYSSLSNIIFSITWSFQDYITIPLSVHLPFHMFLLNFAEHIKKHKGFIQHYIAAVQFPIWQLTVSSYVFSFVCDC